MDKLILVAGNVAAVIGLLMCLGAGLIRLAGNFHLFGYSLMTIFTAGMGLLLMACLAKLQLLLRRDEK